MSDFSLVLKKTISKPPQDVFKAWSDPHIMQQWLFPPSPGWKANTVNEFNIGGKFRHAMISMDGTIYLHTGTYQEIIPNEKLVFTWTSDTVKATVVTLDFHNAGQTTELLLSHDFLPSEEECERHTEGWFGTLGNLQKFLSKRTKYLTVQG